jgi:RNA polymerase sigma factor (sigma-70 family)
LSFPDSSPRSQAGLLSWRICTSLPLLNNIATTTAWFCQILAHEPDLRIYLGRSLARRADVSDVIQETYARLLTMPPLQREAVRTLRAFLFATAHNVAMEHLRQSRWVSLDALPELGLSHVVAGSGHEPPPDETVNATQELDLLARVIASLPDKCREVLTLRKIHGLSQKEIAARLGIAEHTVEKHISYGIRLCAARLLEMTGSARRH